MARDDSVSPMTRSPPTTSPANDTPYTPPVVAGALAPAAPVQPRDALALQDVTGHEIGTAPVQASSQSPGLPAATPQRDSADPKHAESSGGAAVQPAPDSPGTPGTGRVQFARFDPPEFQPSHSRHGSLENPDGSKSRSGSIMSKLKSLTPTALQSPKSPPPDFDGSIAAASSPTAGRFPSRVHNTLHEQDSDDDVEGEADADVDETADEAQVPEAGASKKKKKKRRMRRFVKGDGSAPGSPFRFPNDGEAFGNRFLKRRASMPDPSIHNSGGLSEGEAQHHARRRPFAKRGHSWMNATMTQPEDEGEGEGGESSAVVGRRQGHTRRITVFGGGGVSDGDAIIQRRPFFHSERATNYGAQKWKQVKSTLKLLRQKKEDRFDYYKSAELMAELRAGAPAVLMFASMIQRDEHGNKRIPVLLEQLKLKITDSTPVPDDDKERHWNFTINLEYGSGPSRMVWTIVRNIRDIYNLHFRYRFALNNDKYLPGRLGLAARLKQPKFPYSAFPYLRGARDKEDSSEDEEAASGREHIAEEPEEAAAHAADDAEGTGSDGGGNRHPRRKKSRVNMLGMRRRSTGFTDGEGANDPNASPEAMRLRYVEKQRRTLEQYLSEMIRWLMFRADSNRLCRFLELSALGVRLAAEGSYHGKEGYLHIQSAKGLDFRRVLTPAKVIARHSRKWFLVRQSYIVCVESPENMNIYDVYLVDSKFTIASKRNPLKQIASKKKKEEIIDLNAEPSSSKHHTLTLRTAERKVRLFSRYHAVMKQFEESITEMLRETVWSQKQRFDSYAPVRQGVFAQWLVDGRDYMWNVSRAINMAKDVIYIHDWWLSPELYMRRPAAISQKWRLDRLLQKKAREGVKIFVIIYRNVEAAIPIDSEYTKFSLLNLHPNIFVQRSPNQFKKNQFFFAHHEKICVVDHDVAFLGGIDLCFGRWDCPQHPVADDKPTGFEMTDAPKDAEHCQLFPGKDYSNPRVQDFFRLNEPYEEMYDRSKVPRMPWHDISMQVVGQPARDLTRHFVQRWNYLRRGRKSTRPLPFLLPPPEAKFEELENLGLTGTCEVQMLRSASNWSLGLEETEHSIQTAYIKMIEDSHHFVYIENQFFISSTEAYNTRIVNRIGDAIVSRIVRAHENGEDWRCVILIPLMPGFQNTVDEQEGTSVRLIIMCQFQSICRGENSVFGRLRAAGIEPEDYIDFFSLRQWGVMSTDALVTEQLYIHAKAMIVDDRIAIIGSANINERSMVGHRDSECAAIVRDTDMIWSTMAGKPYQVGRFAHTLRMRLMREHLGLDTDAILEEERQTEANQQFEQQMDKIYDGQPEQANANGGESSSPVHPGMHHLRSFNHALDLDMAKAVDPASSDEEKTEGKGKQREGDPKFHAENHRNDVIGYGTDQWKAAEKSGLDAGRDSIIVEGREFLVSNVDPQGKGTLAQPQQKDDRDAEKPLEPITEDKQLPPLPPFDERGATLEPLRPAQLPTLPEDGDADMNGDHLGAFRHMAAEIKQATITKDCMKDPITPEFIDEIWNRVARNNTKLYRKVFRCMPDSEVKTWSEYRDFIAYGKRFKETMDGRPAAEEQDATSEAGGNARRPASGGAIGISVPDLEALANLEGEDTEKMAANLSDHHTDPNVTGEKREDDTDEKAAGTADEDREMGAEAEKQTTGSDKLERKTTTFANLEKPTTRDTTAAAAQAQFGSVKKRRRAATKSSRRFSNGDDMPSRSEAEGLLKMVQGNLVEFPYDWLITEEHNGNWGYQVDGVAPLAIYN